MLFWLISAVAAMPLPAQSALLRGDCASFQSQVASRQAPTIQLALARCGDSAGLESLGSSAGSLAKWARLAQALSTPEAEAGTILRLLEGLEFPGAAGEQAQLLRGKALVALGRSLEARPILRTLLGSLDNRNNLHGAEARYWLSKGAEDRGEISAAQSTYENVWVYFPTSPWSAEAQQRLAGLGVELPSIETEHQQNLTLARARRLIKRNRADEAVPLDSPQSAPEVVVNEQEDEGEF